MPELSELDAASEEIAEKEKAAQVEIDLIEESGKKSELQDKANAEVMGFQAMGFEARSAKKLLGRQLQGRRRRKQDVVGQTPLTL